MSGLGGVVAVTSLSLEAYIAQGRGVSVLCSQSTDLRKSLKAAIARGARGVISFGIAGGLAPDFAVQLAPVSNIFLRLIKSIIAPLIFGTLVYGIAGAGDIKAMGRIGAKAILYFEIVTTAALFLGLGAVTNLNRWLSWQVTASDRFLSNPVAGRRRNDVLFTTGLRLKFAR